MSAPSSMPKGTTHSAFSGPGRLEWPSPAVSMPRSTNAPSPTNANTPAGLGKAVVRGSTRHGVIQIAAPASTCGGFCAVPLSQDIHETIAKEGSFEDPALKTHASLALVDRPRHALRNWCQVSGHGDVRLVGQPELAEARRADDVRRSSTVHTGKSRQATVFAPPHAAIDAHRAPTSLRLGQAP